MPPIIFVSVPIKITLCGLGLDRNCDCVSARVAALQPQQRKSKQRDEDIRPENDAGISWRKVVRGDHLNDVTDRRAQREDTGTKIVAPEGCEQTDGGVAKARGPDFELERTVGPTDEGSGHLAEEDVHDKIIEVIDPDTEEYVPGEELFDDDCPVETACRSRNSDQRDDQSDQKETQRIVGHQENDGCFDQVGQHVLPSEKAVALRIRRMGTGGAKKIMSGDHSQDDAVSAKNRGYLHWKY
jgi:hypothetical protein